MSAPTSASATGAGAPVMQPPVVEYAEKQGEAPPMHNPEALEDVRPAPTAPVTDARFQNVDLEAGNAAPPVVTETKTTTNPLEKSALTEFARHTDWGVIQFLLAFCALVVMVASSTICGGTVFPPTGPSGGSCEGILGYQVACGTISAFFALVSALLYHLGKLDNVRVLEGISLFQFLWWTAGMIVLTFFGSFQSVAYGNGYFGTWGAFFFATIGLVSTSDMFQNSVDRAVHSVRAPLLFLVAASAVAMGASISPCSPSSQCTDYNGFAVALSTISLFLAIVLLLAANHLPHTVLKACGVFLVLWWVIGFAVVSFGGPFIAPGNGYFASLGAVFISVTYLKMVMANAPH